MGRSYGGVFQKPIGGKLRPTHGGSMAAIPPAREVIHFGAFEVDLRAGELRKQGTKIKLQEQPFQVLRVLLEQAGQVVTREELQQKIWPADTFVDFDHGLNNAIRRLREALCDSAENPRFIETLSRRGYRFITPVNRNEAVAARVAQEAPLTPNVATKPGPWHQRKALKLLAAFVVVALLLGVALVANPGRIGKWFSRESGSPNVRSLAVLPLQNLSNDPAQEYFSDGMTDALITDLAQIGSVKVISRTSSMQYKQTKKTLPEIAHELNVDSIVEGTVQRSGDRVRITAQLIQVSTDNHLWANSYEGDMGDLFALERQVTQDVARQIETRVAKENRPLSPQPSPLNSKALEAYLQGNYYLNRFGKGAGDEEKRKAAEYFQQAIDADPNFAPAYNGLANTHLVLLWPSNKDANIATKAAERAVELDPNLSDAHKTLGDIKFSAWEWSASEQEYRKAIALNPYNAAAHVWLGVLLDATGRLDEGLKEQQIAQELDPGSDQLSDALMLRGHYDQAIAMIQVMLKRNPDDGFLHWTLFKDYVQKGLYEESIPHLEQMWNLYGYPKVAAEAHRAYAASGYRGAVQESVKAMEHLTATNQAFLPGNIAEFYATLGDKDRAFYWLEQAYAQHDLEMASTDASLEHLNREFRLDSLRSDPRFKDLLRRVGLPEVRR